MKANSIKQLNRNNNDHNLKDYKKKTNPNYKPKGFNGDVNEAEYYNHYYKNGKVNIGNTITLKK